MREQLTESHDRAMKEHDARMQEHDACMKTLDERIANLVSGTGEFMPGIV